MSKFVRLNKERTETISPYMAIRPNPIKNIPDDKINQYGWFKIKEVRGECPDKELYHLVRDGWSFHEPAGEEAYVEVVYSYQIADIEQQRAVMVGRCHAYRDMLLSMGLTFRGKLIDTKPETKQRVLSHAVAAIQNPNLTVDWIVEDNTILTLDASGIQSLSDAFNEFESDIVSCGRSIKDQILTSDNPIDFDFTIGWPDTEYGED